MKMISFSHTIYDLHKVVAYMKDKKLIDKKGNEIAKGID